MAAKITQHLSDQRQAAKFREPGYQVVHGMADLVDRQLFWPDQLTVFIQGAFFQKAVDGLGRIEKIIITPRIPVAGLEYRALLADIKSGNNIERRAFDGGNFLL